MKRFEIWAEFPDGCEAKVESWKSLKQASKAGALFCKRYNKKLSFERE